MKKFFSAFGFQLNIGATFLLLLAYLAPFVPPDLFWPLAFFGLAYPYLVFLNVGFLIIWVIFRSTKLLLPLISLLIGYTDLANAYQLFPSTVTSKNKGITVLSYNVHSFRIDQQAHRLNNPKILDYFKSVGADIICLQEGVPFKEGKLSPQGIKEALPGINYYQTALPGNYSDLITFSKYPIISKGELKFRSSPVLVLYADLKISESQIVRVYNCHLQSYSIDPDDHFVIDSLSSGLSDHQIKEARKVSFKLKNGFVWRAYQARTLAEHIRKSPYPVIVCGDFNDTPVSYAYRNVRGDMKDAFVESGWGVSNNYNGLLPSFRIDYILSDKKLVPMNYKRDRVPFSDHFPVHCRLRFDQAGK